MAHTYSLEVFRANQWVAVKRELRGTVAALGSALAMLKEPGELWRVTRDDGEIICP